MVVQNFMAVVPMHGSLILLCASYPVFLGEAVDLLYLLVLQKLERHCLPVASPWLWYCRDRLRQGKREREKEGKP